MLTLAHVRENSVLIFEWSLLLSSSLSLEIRASLIRQLFQLPFLRGLYEKYFSRLREKRDRSNLSKVFFFFFSSFSRKIHRKVSKKNNLKGGVFRSVALLGGSLSLCLRNSIILFLRPLTTLRALRPIISSIFITHRAASALIKATLRSRVFLPLCESV